MFSASAPLAGSGNGGDTAQCAALLAPWHQFSSENILGGSIFKGQANTRGRTIVFAHTPGFMSFYQNSAGNGGTSVALQRVIPVHAQIQRRALPKSTLLGPGVRRGDSNCVYPSRCGWLNAVNRP